MHSSIQKGVELMGLGSRSLRKIEVDDDFRIDTSALRRTIEEDITAGMKPICLVGNAGTVNTGAIDPLDELADIAAEYGMWYHVDGAFGALAYLSPDLRAELAGMQRANSIAFDLHKWVYVPFEAGCVLVRERGGPPPHLLPHPRLPAARRAGASPQGPCGSAITASSSPEACAPSKSG